MPPTIVADPAAPITSLGPTLRNQYAIYSTQSPNNASYLADSKNLDNKIQGLNLQLQQINRQEETYDREFLDRKSNPSKKGFLYRMGLRTTEDFVFAYFFFSYIIFFFILLVTVQLYSTTKVFASAIVVGSGLIFGLTALYFLYWYA